MSAQKSRALKAVHALFPAAHLVLGLLFAACGVTLIVFAIARLWSGVAPGEPDMSARLDAVLEGLAVMTVALAALELGQTIIEEEVQREIQMSAPTRVRRFLSRFLVVLVVALSIESLVLVFRYSHEEPANLTYASLVALSAAALLLAWGIFVRLNCSAEELEPEAMRETKQEDRKVR